MYTRVHISAKNVALWDICLVHCGVCEMGTLYLLGTFDVCDVDDRQYSLSIIKREIESL